MDIFPLRRPCLLLVKTDCKRLCYKKIVKIGTCDLLPVFTLQSSQMHLPQSLPI